MPVIDVDECKRGGRGHELSFLTIVGHGQEPRTPLLRGDVTALRYVLTDVTRNGKRRPTWPSTSPGRTRWLRSPHTRWLSAVPRDVRRKSAPHKSHKSRTCH